MNEADDQALIESILAGSTGALGEYLTRHRVRLMGFLRHITGDHLLAVVELDDLFQEVSRSAIAALPKIPKADLDIELWLQRLARRRVVDAHREHFHAAKRSNNRNQVFSQMAASDQSDAVDFEQLLIASMTSPSLAVSRNFRLERLQQALAELSAEQQQIIRLRFIDGLPTAEIADRLGKSDGAIRVALSRLLAQLQSSLANDSGGGSR